MSRNFEDLPHVTKEQVQALKDLLENDTSLYEEFYTLVKCGLEEQESSFLDDEEIAERVVTCLMLVVKGSL